MPLVRKPSPPTAAPPPAAGFPDATARATSAGRRRARLPSGPTALPLLAAALATESDPRVREAIFTSLARIATAESAAAVLPYVRSDDASLRTGALDACARCPARPVPHVAGLLADPDADVRLLGCELARSLPATRPTACSATARARDQRRMSAAAAVEVLAEIGRPGGPAGARRAAPRVSPATPFLLFSIKVAADRIASQPTVS